ncbi:hypothetical protein MASR1M32_14900 [Rhodobacter sp.]
MPRRGGFWKGFLAATEQEFSAKIQGHGVPRAVVQRGFDRIAGETSWVWEEGRRGGRPCPVY